MSEKELQKAVSKYLKLQYPKVIFTSESSGIKLTMGQAKAIKAMRSPERGLPDMIILEPKGEYRGLMIELKAESNSPFKKDGTLKKDEHIKEQQKCLAELTKRGYKAVFAVGIDEAIATIDDYMRL